MTVLNQPDNNIFPPALASVSCRQITSKDTCPDTCVDSREVLHSEYSKYSATVVSTQSCLSVGYLNIYLAAHDDTHLCIKKWNCTRVISHIRLINLKCEEIKEKINNTFLPSKRTPDSSCKIPDSVTPSVLRKLLTWNNYSTKTIWEGKIIGWTTHYFKTNPTF